MSWFMYYGSSQRTEGICCSVRPRDEIVHFIPCAFPIRVLAQTSITLDWPRAEPQSENWMNHLDFFVY